MYERRVYKITNIKKLESNDEQATISKIEKVIPAIFNGQFTKVCNIADKIIVATGIAKNTKRLFMFFLPFGFIIVY